MYCPFDDKLLNKAWENEEREKGDYCSQKCWSSVTEHCTLRNNTDIKI
jgi:hypothetical protein